MAKAAKEMAKSWRKGKPFCLRRGDLQKGFLAEKDAAVSFQVYIDDKGAVACEIRAACARRPFCWKEYIYIYT